MKLFVNVQRRNMSVWLAVILLLGAFIHGSLALKCYTCETSKGEFCDDPINKDRGILDKGPEDCNTGDEGELCRSTCEDGNACLASAYLLTGMQISYVTQRQR